MFEIDFDPDWDYYWKRVPRERQERILKKMQQLKEDKKFRHLKLGSPNFVLEIGEYRILFIEKENKRTLMFVGP